MFNRTPYNRTRYNRKANFVFEWTANVTAEAGSSGNILIIRYLTADVDAVAEASGGVVRVVLPEGIAAEGVSEALGDYNRTRFFEGTAEAVAEALGESLSTYGQEVMVIEGVNMNPGDELIIDTEHMTVTLNGVNIVDRVKDDSIFFKLKSGVNNIVVEGGTVADIKILWKDRWL